MDWQPIESAPLHKEILVFHHENGVFFAQQTSLTGLFSDARIDEMYAFGELKRPEDEFEHQNEWWLYMPDGVELCEGAEIPTHWMPLPQPPGKQEAGL